MTTSGDGGTWPTAFKTLQEALTAANSCPNVTQIWVAKGTYYPDEGGSFANNDRNAAFAMKNGVGIYGGFNGTETQLSQRNWRTNVTTLSGDIGAAGNADNSYRVINNSFSSNAPLTNTAWLDGFTIEAANADGNFPLNLGGGMWNDNASPTVRNCIFKNNTAVAGGGIFNANSQPLVTNCLFVGNSGSANGAAIANGGGTTLAQTTNCTFYGNTGSNTINNQSAAAITNCIVWGNEGGISGGTVTYSNVQGGFSGTGNLNVDPRFVNAASGDFRLQQCSAAIDAGTTTDSPTTDFVGNARVDALAGAGVVDLGAYEYQSTYDVCTACLNIMGGIVYVNAAASGSNNGTSWANAFTDLHSALSVARAYPCVSQIWVANGTYTPGATLSMKNGVAIYGGFVGTETTLTDRTLTAPLSTILSGGGVRPVFNNRNINNTALLDGFVITGGKGGNGGGMYNENSSPTLTNCSFQNNSATNGGGMFNFNSSPTLTNCSFQNNTITNGGFGGGMYNENSSPRLTNCIFQNNTATNTNGGGMYNAFSSSPTLTNCSFQNNTATNGGGMFNFSSSPTLTNCVVFGNGGNSTFVNQNSTLTATYSLFDNTVTGYTDGGSNRTTVTTPFASTSSTELSACSPALNVGSNTAYTTANGPATDLAGNARTFPTGGTIDLGAYEYQAAPNEQTQITIEPAEGQTVCAGSGITASVSATGTDLSYQWYKGETVVDGQTTATLTLTKVQPGNAGSYTLRITGTCNNVTSTAYVLAVKPLPIASIAGNGGAICSGGTASFTVSGTSGSTLTYTLTGQSGNQTLILNGSDQTITASNATADVTLTLVSVALNGCPASLTGSSMVTVKPLPTASIAGNGGAVCAGGAASFTVSGTSGATLTYTLTGQSGNQTLILNGSSQTITASNATADVTLTLVSVVLNGCPASLTGSSMVTVNALPTLTTSGNTSVIYGYGSNCTDITATASSGPASLTWSTGATGGSIQVCPTATTTYTVTARGANGCTVSREITVSVNDVRCGGNSSGVNMCYQGREVCVAPYLVPTYQRYGATLGACGTGGNTRIGAQESSELPLQLTLKAYPNPVVDAVTVEVLSPQAGGATFEVVEVSGRVRQTQRRELSEGLNEVELRLGSLPTGIYLIRILDAAGRQATVRVSKE